MVYLQLLYSYLKIGFFGFGGGYAMLALIQNEVVVRHHWLTNSELTDIIAISQMTPGPIAINSATYVGYTVTGNIWGSLLATFAVSLPSLTIMLLITKFYMVLHNNRYVRDAMYGMLPMVVAMILAPVLLLMLRNLWRAGMFHATVRDLTMAARDMAAILHGRPEETDPPEPEKPGETVQKMEKES